MVLYCSSEISLRHGRVFVKQGGNEVRIDGHEEQGDHHGEHPEVDEEVIPAPVDNLDHPGQDRRLNHLANDELLDLIFHVEAWSLLVKSMLLFEHKLSVDAEG